uniref:Uncharacterized protein n=1 Tax=Arundo donax TaxID=35708 RepID=A0A0A8Y5X1_ARUDO
MSSRGTGGASCSSSRIHHDHVTGLGC